MMASWIPNLIPSLAWALLDFVWQGLLIGWITALLLGALRGAKPQARYLVACLALLACVAMPLAGVLNRIIDVQASAASVLPKALIQMQGAGDTVAEAAPGAKAPAWNPLPAWESELQSRLPLIVLLWSIGAALLSLRLLTGLAWVRRQRASARHLWQAHWQGRVDDFAQRLGIARKVTLAVVDDLQGPVTAGWWRPVVLLPASLLTGMPPHLLEALIAHELAHVKRCDYLVNLLQSAVEVLLFYHPTVWWLSGRIRVEREQIADDLAASLLGEPRRLALALSELDLFQFSTSQLAPAAHGGKLMSRISRLVRPTKEPLNWKLALPILGLSLACTGLYAWADTPSAQAAPGSAAVPATSATAATPAAPGTPAAAPKAPKAPKASREAHRHGDSNGAPFALVRADDKGSMFSTGRDDRGEINKLKQEIKGDFIWFREDGKSYVVKDAATVAKAREAFAPLDKLGAEMEVHGNKMRAQGDVMRELGDEMRREMAKGMPEREAMRAQQKEMRELANEQRKLAREYARSDSDSGRAERDAKMAAIQAKIAAQAEKMAAQGAAVQAHHAEEVGKKMHEAGKPMEELGKQMGALGKQMEAQSKVAEEQVRVLIAEAKKAGLAQATK